MNKTSILYTAVIAALSSASFGQDEAPGTGLALEEVIVTAQKREQTLQDVPVSVVGLPLAHGIDYTYTRRIGISAQVWF